MATRSLRRLSTNQKLTLASSVASLAIAIAGLATAIVAARNAADTSDLKNAVMRLTVLAQQSKRQAKATEDEVIALQSQAMATSKLLAPVQLSAEAAINGVRQQALDFSMDQRPLIGGDQIAQGYDPNPQFVAAVHGFVWSYGYKNFGKSIAYDVSSKEMLSVYGRPFYVAHRLSREVLPNETDWSTAFYPLLASDPSPPKANPAFVLVVTYSYKDGAGRTYSKTICRQKMNNGAEALCMPSLITKLGIDQRDARAAAAFADKQ